MFQPNHADCVNLLWRCFEDVAEFASLKHHLCLNQFNRNSLSLGWHWSLGDTMWPSAVKVTTYIEGVQPEMVKRDRPAVQITTNGFGALHCQRVLEITSLLLISVSREWSTPTESWRSCSCPLMASTGKDLLPGCGHALSWQSASRSEETVLHHPAWRDHWHCGPHRIR